MLLSDFMLKMNDVTFDSVLCDQFIELASQEHWNGLDQIGLILIAPESFKLGIVDQILKFIEEKGLCILDAALLDKYDEERLAIHIPKLIKKNFRWWMIQRRFMMGPTGAILLCNAKYMDKPLTSYIKEIKGFRIPSQATTDSVRAHLPSINGLLNLIHSPDHSVHLLRDSEPFFHINRIFSAIDYCKQIQVGDTQPIPAKKVLDTYFKGFITKNYGCNNFFSVLYNIIYKVIHIVLLKTVVEKQTLIQLIDDMDAHKLSYKENIQISKQYAQLSTFIERVTSVLTSLRDAPTVGPTGFHIAKVMSNWLNVSTAHTYDWMSDLKVMREFGVCIDSWEELIFISSMVELKETQNITSN